MEGISEAALPEDLLARLGPVSQCIQYPEVMTFEFHVTSSSPIQKYNDGTSLLGFRNSSANRVHWIVTRSAEGIPITE